MSGADDVFLFNAMTGGQQGCVAALKRSDEEKVQESGGTIWGKDERQGRRVKFDLNFCACFSPVTKKGGRKLERRCRLVAGVKEFDAPLFRSRYIFFPVCPQI